MNSRSSKDIYLTLLKTILLNLEQIHKQISDDSLLKNFPDLKEYIRVAGHLNLGNLIQTIEDELKK